MNAGLLESEGYTQEETCTVMMAIVAENYIYTTTLSILSSEGTVERQRAAWAVALVGIALISVGQQNDFAESV